MNRPVLLSTIAAAVVLSTAALPARALQVTFAGNGVVQGPTPTLPFFNGLHIGPADASYTLDGVAGWTIDVAFDGEVQTSFIDGGLILGGWSGTMSGRFVRGGDSLVFTGTQASAALGEPIALNYAVSGGTGLFAGYTGSGSSSVVLMGNPLGLPAAVPFVEVNGVMNLQPVPEAATWALWAIGLLAVAGARRRC